MKKTVIITAGGSGKRMGNDIPKQFLLLNNKPILQYSIEAFYNYDPTIQIILTLPKEWIPFWKDLCLKNQFLLNYEIVEGGKERYYSIKNALKISKGELIAIHDGVRPLVSLKIIENTFQQAFELGSSIPVIQLTDSIRKLNSTSTRNKSKSVLRKDFVLVQTPQTFKSTIIKHAYNQVFHEGITDDASLVEQLGQEIFMTEGEVNNLKITTPLDLKIASFFLDSI